MGSKERVEKLLPLVAVPLGEMQGKARIKYRCRLELLSYFCIFLLFSLFSCFSLSSRCH